MFFLLTLLAQAESTAVPNFQNSSFDFTWLFVKVIFVMVLVCAAAFGVIKYVIPHSHLIRKNKNSKIEILDRLSLEPKKNLYVLKVAQKILLVGITDHSMQTLVEFDQKDFKDETQNK